MRWGRGWRDADDAEAGSGSSSRVARSNGRMDACALSILLRSASPFFFFFCLGAGEVHSREEGSVRSLLGQRRRCPLPLLHRCAVRAVCRRGRYDLSPVIYGDGRDTGGSSGREMARPRCAGRGWAGVRGPMVSGRAARVWGPCDLYPTGCSLVQN